MTTIAADLLTPVYFTDDNPHTGNLATVRDHTTSDQITQRILSVGTRLPQLETEPVIVNLHPSVITAIREHSTTELMTTFADQIGPVSANDCDRPMVFVLPGGGLAYAKDPDVDGQCPSPNKFDTPNRMIGAVAGRFYNPQSDEREFWGYTVGMGSWWETCHQLMNDGYVMLDNNGSIGNPSIAYTFTFPLLTVCFAVYRWAMRNSRCPETVSLDEMGIVFDPNWQEPDPTSPDYEKVLAKIPNVITA